MATVLFVCCKAAVCLLTRAWTTLCAADVWRFSAVLRQSQLVNLLLLLLLMCFFFSLHSPKLKFRLIFHAALNLPGSCGFAGSAVPGRQTSGTLVHAALHHTPRSLQLQLPAFFRGSCADGRRTAKLISDVGEPIRLLPFQALPHRALKNPKHWGRCATYQLRKLLPSERKIQQGWKSVHSEAFATPEHPSC